MSERELSLSIVIPAYNEGTRIRATLSRIVAYLPSFTGPSEVIVVDDGSTDETFTLARDFGPPVEVIRHETNRGKGAAVRTGVTASRGRTILFMDADLSTDIEEWVAFEKKMADGYAIVIGSRSHSDSNIRIRQSWYRERMGKTFNWILRRVLPLRFKDTQCGFKVFELEAAKLLFGMSRINGFAFDAEILFLAERLGYRIAELPVTWSDSGPSRVHPIRHSLQMLRDLLRIRYSFAFDHYALPKKSI